MFTTTAAKCAAQRQASMFGDDEAPPLALTEYPTPADAAEAAALQHDDDAETLGAMLARCGDEHLQRTMRSEINRHRAEAARLRAEG